MTDSRLAVAQELLDRAIRQLDSSTEYQKWGPELIACAAQVVQAQAAIVQAEALESIDVDGVGVVLSGQ